MLIETVTIFCVIPESFAAIYTNILIGCVCFQCI